MENPAIFIILAGKQSEEKSALAKTLGEKLGAPVLNHALLCAALFPPEQGISAAQEDYVFELLLGTAGWNLKQGKYVLLDGQAFARPEQVERIARFGEELKVKPRWVLVGEEEIPAVESALRLDASCPVEEAIAAVLAWLGDEVILS